MDDEEHEDLLIRAGSDNDDFTDTEDAFGIARRNYFLHDNLPTLCYEKIKFICLGLILVVSSTALLILLPLYMETANVHSDAYSMLVFICVVATIAILLIGCVFGKSFHQIKIMLGIPFSFSTICRSGIVYGLSGMLFLYALDRKRVMCHLQDPIKGIVLVFSLVYYFFFCKKMMGLQQIFCSTTIVVGLFVSVDYGLCDEFRCRGHERQHRMQDAGSWSWQVHSLWTVLYIAALALWTLHSTLLEGFIVLQQATDEEGDFSSLSHTQTERSTGPVDQLRQITYAKPQIVIGSRPSAVSICLWHHIISLQLLLMFCWTDMIPSIGKGRSLSEAWSFFTSGFMCHFGFEPNMNHNGTEFVGYEICTEMVKYAWPFIVTYVIFSLSFVQFLIISESSVFTVAMTTAALPLGSIWWSLFKMPPLDNVLSSKNLLLWSPSITGELICSVLGLPVVLVGLAILYKSHFQDNAPRKPCSRHQSPGVA